MIETTNGWIETVSGKKFDPINPKADDIDLLDIAHALSMLCRYAGHTPTFYSVAQHSVHVATMCSKKNRLWGLLHDAAEAYISDIPRPVKQHLPRYREIEEGILRAVAEHFKLPYPIPEEVLRIDSQMLKIEHRDIMSSVRRWECDGLDDLHISITKVLPPKEAYAAFLTGYEWLKEMPLR